MAFSPDGAFLATGSRDTTARLWEVASGNCAATLEGHSHEVTSVAFDVQVCYCHFECKW